MAILLPTAICALAVILSLTSTPGSLAHAESIISMGNCPELNNYYINRVLPLVGPSGLTSSNAYVNTRSPPRKPPTDPGTPGGPAGLRLYPMPKPKRVEFSNITKGIDGGEEPDDDTEGPDFSGTNVQVKGVDEPDIIKTDGKRVFTISNDIFSSVKVNDEGNSGERVGKLRLPTYPNDMLIDGDWVLVIGNDYDYKRPVHRRYKIDPGYGEESTIIYQLNVAEDKPRLVSTLRLEGGLVKAREVDGNARFVIRFSPLNSIWMYYSWRRTSRAQTEKWNREIIQYSQPGNWLPTYILKRSGRVQTGVYATCSEIYRAREKFSGFDILTVVTFPVKGILAPESSASVLSNGEQVYSTKTAMYVTTSEFHFGDISDSSTRWGDNYKTSIHKFNVTDEGAKYIASGEVTGSVINQFAMHEYLGTFFIATTDGATWWSSRDLSASKVTSFQVDVSSRILRKVGEVGNLGVSERIYSVRFKGDTAYVVTFRETDPLYIIDLSDPRNLRVLGELKIPGFSSYLHVVSPGRVLGVGQEATATGRTLGAKISLFDVSDKRNPKELATWTLRGSYTSAEWDHRAFLYWRKEGVAILPVEVYQWGKYFSGAIVFDITDSEIKERGRITHLNPSGGWTWSIMRNAIIGNNIWSMSSEFLQVNNLKNPGDIKDKVTIS